MQDAPFAAVPRRCGVLFGQLSSGLHTVSAKSPSDSPGSARCAEISNGTFCARTQAIANILIAVDMFMPTAPQKFS